MTYAIGHALGATPANWGTWSASARVADIRVRAGVVRAMARVMGEEIAKANAPLDVRSYGAVLDTLKAMARAPVQQAIPVQVVRGAVLYGVGQMERLGKAALVAADSVLTDRANLNSAVVNPKNTEALRLAAQAVDTAEQIQGALLGALNALSAIGLSGLGDADSRIYALVLGVLFSGLTGGASFYVAVLYSLADYFEVADDVVSAIERLTSRAFDSVAAVAKEIARPVGRAVGDWLKFVLISGTVIGGGYIAWNLWLTKRAARRVF